VIRVGPHPEERRGEDQGAAQGEDRLRGRRERRRAGDEDRDERWYLTDERDFLRRSLADADREREAGDLSAEDHAALRARDTARLVEVEAELATLGPEEPPPVPPAKTGSTSSTTSTTSTDSTATNGKSGTARLSVWRRIVFVVACLLVVTGGVILVVHSLQGREPGQFSSGGITLNQAQQIEQQLNQALTLNNAGNQGGALQLYNKVLTEDPSNPAALASAGYLQWNIGAASHVSSLTKIGRAEVAKSVRVSPSYFEGHLFLGLIDENQDHDHKAAVGQFNAFLADNPPTAELSQVAPLVIGSYQAAGVPVPAAFSASSSSTSTPSSTP
jgi:tetratricopeptide (TPR) repeat protein